MEPKSVSRAKPKSETKLRTRLELRTEKGIRIEIETGHGSWLKTDGCDDVSQIGDYGQDLLYTVEAVNNSFISLKNYFNSYHKYTKL
ncbi:hypothetical protein EVAR_89582_1 [Eumeta japonica]|uniref:Uncharacterized protein n=1 Tax=Eumeta variegata TaxID=151549 RepID=A0A4C1SG07_EUMVA|nr:hypothetical protein EVAR_89582_1 [Eumeta japonica]